MVTTELLPCPFCGYDVNENDPLDTVYPADREMTLWQVVCNDCSATAYGETKEDAITRWNTRK